MATLSWKKIHIINFYNKNIFKLLVWLGKHLNTFFFLKKDK